MRPGFKIQTTQRRPGRAAAGAGPTATAPPERASQKVGDKEVALVRKKVWGRPSIVGVPRVTSRPNPSSCEQTVVTRHRPGHSPWPLGHYKLPLPAAAGPGRAGLGSLFHSSSLFWILSSAAK